MTRKVIMAKKQIRHRIIGIIVTSVAVLTLSACGSNKSAESIAQNSLQTVGCKSFQSETWNSLYRIAEEGTAFPTTKELRDALFEGGKAKGMTGAKFERFVDSFIENYQVTIEGVKQRFNPEDPEAWKKALGEMEIGIRVTSVHAELNDQIVSANQKMDQAEQALDVSCEQPDSGENTGGGKDGGFTDPIVDIPDPGVKSGTVWSQIKTSSAPIIYGARKTLSIAYQSCEVLALNEMTSSTPEVEGIKVVGKHPSGGLRREIASLSSLLATDYYYVDNKPAKPTCFDVRKSPMIYDFGGKPYTTSSSPYHLNMFKNGGSGTSVLGIDCSGYIFSALGIAGLKLDPDPKKELKALQVGSVGSGSFKEPQSNGLRCLEKIKVSKTSTIEAGDIIAINGHVMMVDEIGDDPFGLDDINSSSDCSKVSSAKFGFVISQSSPSKGGIGINRYRFSDYAAGSTTFKKGVEAYAFAACKAKFGGSATVSSPNLSIIRHKGTAECKAAKALTEENEDCVSSCKAI